MTFGTAGDEDCETAPVLTVASVSNTSATITWPAVQGAAWYEFRYKASASSTWISCGTLSGTGTTRVLNGLIANTQYDFQARTYCSGGSTGSGWGSTLQFNTAGVVQMTVNEDPIEMEVAPETIGELSLEGLGTKKISARIYPNPTSNLVTIETNMENASLVIYNALGSVMYKGYVDTRLIYSLDKVQSGVYLFEVCSEKGTVMKRIVKQ